MEENVITPLPPKNNRIKGYRYLYNNEIKLWNGKTLMTICEHNKRKYDCKLCNGSNRCSHGKIKISCKICSPDTFCEHNKRKTVCKICKGNSLCDHNTLKYLCKICKGGSICIHNKRKNECRLCDGSCFCNHNKKKVNVEYVLLIIIHFVFIVNIFGVLKNIYPQKIHMKNFVLIVIIIYIQMKKKYQLNIRKNNILFMKNFKKNMVKIISNMMSK